MKKPENELNENTMSIINMPAFVVPMPPPLVRSVCYLPEHYHPFLKHTDETNCLCSFCAHARFAATAKEIKEAVKELSQIDALKEETLWKNLDEIDWDKIVPGKLTRQVCDDGLGPIVLPDGKQLWDESLDPIVLEEEILLQPEEEILLQPVSRSLDMPIPKLSRSTNDPSTWEDADEEILLTGLRL